MKKLSIIIPVYNGQEYIKECLDSIYDSDNIENNIEIIVINDGSIDASINILKDIAKKSSVMRIYSNDNHGVSFARNYGIDISKSEYIMFVDIDDKLEKNWYGIIQPYLEKNRDILYFSDIIANDKQELINYIGGNNDSNICISQPFSKIFNRKFLIKNNLRFNEKLINGEDMIFNLEALLKTNNYEIVHKHYYYYRQSLGSATKKFNPEIIENEIEFSSSLIQLNTSSELYDLILFSRFNGLYILLDRICYLKKYKVAKRYFKSIEMLYKNFKFEENIKSHYKKLIISLFYKRLFYCIFFISKFKNVYIKIKLKRKNYVFKIM